MPRAGPRVTLLPGCAKREPPAHSTSGCSPRPLTARTGSRNPGMSVALDKRCLGRLIISGTFVSPLVQGLSRMTERDHHPADPAYRQRVDEAPHGIPAVPWTSDRVCTLILFAFGNGCSMGLAPSPHGMLLSNDPPKSRSFPRRSARHDAKRDARRVGLSENGSIRSRLRSRIAAGICHAPRRLALRARPPGHAKREYGPSGMGVRRRPGDSPGHRAGAHHAPAAVSGNRSLRPMDRFPGGSRQRCRAHPPVVESLPADPDEPNQEAPALLGPDDLQANRQGTAREIPAGARPQVRKSEVPDRVQRPGQDLPPVFSDPQVGRGYPCLRAGRPLPAHDAGGLPREGLCRKNCSIWRSSKAPSTRGQPPRPRRPASGNSWLLRVACTACEVSWWVDERRDPEKSTRGAADYLKIALPDVRLLGTGPRGL